MLNHLCRLALIICLITSALVTVSAEEKDTKVAIKDLPKVVVNAVLKQFPGIKLSEAEKETKNGETIYEIEGTLGNKELEVKVSSSGKVLKKEDDNDDEDEDEDEDDDDEK